MSNYSHAVRYVSDRVWAIHRPTLDVIVNVLGMRAAGITVSDEEIQARIGAAARGSGAASNGSVAVLPLYGIIDHKMSMMTKISGGTGITEFMSAFRQLRDDPSVSAIIIDTDSPGGSVYGVEEAADEIYESRSVKPTIAMVNPECGSAALWIATACKEVVCTPSGMIGSLGCYTVHLDRSEANAKIGVKPTYIAYGDHKVAGNPDSPIDEETLAYMQGQVNAVGEKFVRAVARGRGVSLKAVRDGFGQGRMFSAQDALAVKMIDRIATFDQTIERIAGKRKRNTDARIEADQPQIAGGFVPAGTLIGGVEGPPEAIIPLSALKEESGSAITITPPGAVPTVTEPEPPAVDANLEAQREADQDYVRAAIAIAERSL